MLSVVISSISQLKFNRETQEPSLTPQNLLTWLSSYQKLTAQSMAPSNFQDCQRSLSKRSGLRTKRLKILFCLAKILMKKGTKRRSKPVNWLTILKPCQVVTKLNLVRMVSISQAAKKLESLWLGLYTQILRSCFLMTQSRPWTQKSAREFLTKF